MRHAHRSFLPGLVVLLVLVGFVAPAGMAAAQGEECPEGLVYDEAADMCLPPEEAPAEEAPVEEEPVEEEAPAEEEPVEDATDDGSDEALDEDATDNGELTDDAMEDPAEGAPALAPNETGTIKNLTLLTFACPINWDPATRPIESSREMCTEPIVPNMTYTVLFEGEERVAAAFGVPVDLAETFGPSGPGMYTIRENLQEGLDDPFAFCAIYAADGTSRLTVEETVPGGSLDILLAAGEEVNCEWYSVATVPDVVGDPNAAPSLGLELILFSCPAPAEFNGGLDECTLPLPGPVTFEFSYGGQVVETGTLSPPQVIYSVNANDGRPLSGEWTIRPILPEGWMDPHFTCTNGDITTGASTADATFFPPADGSLGVTTRFNPDQRVQCQVWLFAGDVRESVVVVTRFCPEDYDAATLPPGVRKATCPTEQFHDVTVTVDDAAPVQGESTRNGVAAFPTQPGTWRIAVDPGPQVTGVRGPDVTFVTCDHTLAALGQVQTIEPTINIEQRSVSIELDEGDALRCDFFYSTAPAANESAAPEDAGTGTGETAPDEAAEVEPEAAPAEEAATGTGEGTDAPDTTQPETGGANDPPESAAEGGTFGGGGQAPEGDTGTGETTGDTGAAPAAAGTASLAIQHWDCPDPIAADATADSLIESCTASVQPSTWELNGTPLDAADGYAVWEGLPLETVNVSSSVASGKDDAASAVYCSLALTDVDDPLVGVEAAVRGGAIELVFDQPATVYCNWFVAP